MTTTDRPERAVKLNKTELDKLLKADGLKGAWVPVEGLRGAYVRPASGYVGAYIKYRAGAGGRRAKQVAHMVGRYPPLTPAKLEKQLRDALAAVQLGEDPQAARAKAREVKTVNELLDLYLAKGGGELKPNTLAMHRSKIEGYLRPALGHLRLSEVAQADVERLRDSIVAGRLRAATPDGKPPKGKRCAPGTRAKGGPHAAAKTVQLLQVIFNFAIAQKLCSENPAKGVTVAPDGECERFLSDAELARLGDVLKTCDADPAHVTIIRLLLLTACRKNEIAQLEWASVQDGYLKLARHKTDKTTGPKIVRLGPPAQQLLAKVARGKGPYVFPDARDPSKPTGNLDYAWHKIRKAAELEGVRIHDLRHSHASFALRRGASLFLVSKLLGHKKIKSTERYAHLALDAIQAAATKTADDLDAAMKVKIA